MQCGEHKRPLSKTKQILLTQTFKQQYVSYMQANLSVCFWLPTYRFLFLCTLQSGLIRFSGEELLITPLPQHLALQHNYSAPSGHHPHVIYKRSAERRVYADKTDWSSSVKSNNPYENHDRHHHHHHHHQHGKLQRQHFCGRRKQCM